MKEFENLIFSFNNLSVSDQEKEINDEMMRLKETLNFILGDNKKLFTTDMVKFNGESKNIDDALVKIYHNLILLEEGLAIHLNNIDIN